MPKIVITVITEYRCLSNLPQFYGDNSLTAKIFADSGGQ